MKLRLSFRAKLAIALAGVAAGTAALVLEAAWRQGRGAQLAALRDLLVTTTAAVAPAIDGDAHARIRPSPEAVATPEYAALKALAARLMAANEDFKEVYTISVVDPPRTGFGRLVLSGKDAEVGNEYEYARFPAMEKGLSQPAADADLLEDEYGLTLSGYAPIRNRGGMVVGLLGIDIDAATIRAMRAHLRWILFAAGAAGILVGGGVAWFLSRRIGRPVVALAAGMDRVAQGDYAARLSGSSGDEFDRLFEQFNRMAAGLEERQRLKQALALATEVQQHLLPAKPPDVPGVDVAGASDYCDETGGDYFDYPAWPLPGNRLALTVGDVTGHGISAALLMASGRAVLRLHAERDETPGKVLPIVNRHLARDAVAGTFMTLYYGILDVAAGTLVFSNAGQGGCYVYRAAEDRFDEMPASGPPLGVVHPFDHREVLVNGLRAGDVVCLATDGIWESQNPAGEFYGEERLMAVVRRAAGAPAASMLRTVLDDVEAFRGTAPQTDDVTLVVARLLPAGLP